MLEEEKKKRRSVIHIESKRRGRKQGFTTSFPWLLPSLSISCSNEWIDGSALRIGTRRPRRIANRIVLNESVNERERWRRMER